MNEKGLYVADLVAGDQEKTNQQRSRINLTTSLAIRVLLDKCATVDEAAALLDSIDMHSDIGYSHHLAISDASGKSIVVEWVNNEMAVAESTLCTNHYICDTEKKGQAQWGEDSFRRLKLLAAHEKAT